jgi:hypothetical protein
MIPTEEMKAFKPVHHCPCCVRAKTTKCIALGHLDYMFLLFDTIVGFKPTWGRAVLYVCEWYKPVRVTSYISTEPMRTFHLTVPVVRNLMAKMNNDPTCLQGVFEAVRRYDAKKGEACAEISC